MKKNSLYLVLCASVLGYNVTPAAGNEKELMLTPNKNNQMQQLVQQEKGLPDTPDIKRKAELQYNPDIFSPVTRNDLVGRAIQRGKAEKNRKLLDIETSRKQLFLQQELDDKLEAEERRRQEELEKVQKMLDEMSLNRGEKDNKISELEQETKQLQKRIEEAEKAIQAAKNQKNAVLQALTEDLDSLTQELSGKQEELRKEMSARRQIEIDLQITQQKLITSQQINNLYENGLGLPPSTKSAKVESIIPKPNFGRKK